jgi:hypothetical protein
MIPTSKGTAALDPTSDIENLPSSGSADVFVIVGMLDKVFGTHWFSEGLIGPPVDLTD